MFKLLSPRKLNRLSLVWSAGTILVALPVLLPVSVVLLNLFLGERDVWAHLAENLLPRYTWNTLLLMLGVVVVAAPLGVVSAMLTSLYRFPGSRFFPVLLALPLAMPAYVAGYVYADLFDYAGPLQVLLRGHDLSLPAIPVRSLPGAIIVIALVLYPYIYLLARASFGRQPMSLMDAAATLGMSRRRALLKVALPMARPAVVGGSALVMMETIADYGVVEHYGVPTLTTGIFRTWFAMGEPQAALQLAGCLFLFVACLLVLEQVSRRGDVANPVGRDAGEPTELRGGYAVMAIAWCLIPVLLGFVIPVGTLLVYTIDAGDLIGWEKLMGYLANSVTVGLIAALMATLAAFWLAYAERVSPVRPVRLGIRVATLGYALPGMLLAVGLLRPLSTFDRWLAGLLQDEFGIRTGLIITGSIAGLIIVYVGRFLTVAFNSVESGLAQVHKRYDEAARSLGAGDAAVIRRIHLPLLRPSIAAALMLVFIDVVKELPATLILRPFNFETLATRVYRLASDERLTEASTAALLIVLIALIPSVLMARTELSHRR